MQLNNRYMMYNQEFENINISTPDMIKQILINSEQNAVRLELIEAQLLRVTAKVESIVNLVVQYPKVESIGDKQVFDESAYLKQITDAFADLLQKKMIQRVQDLILKYHS